VILTRESGKNAALLLVVLIGAAARLYHLGTPTMWMDEMQALFGMQTPLSSIWEWTTRHEVHPPLFYLLLKAVSVADVSDAMLRLPEAVCGIVSIWLTYLLGKEVHSEETGLFAAALLSGNTLHIWLSRTLRPYALLILLCILALIRLVRVLRKEDNRDWMWLFILNGAMLLLHVEALLIIAGMGATLLAACIRGKVRWRRLFQFGFFAAIAFIPSVLVFITASTRADMAAPFTHWKAWLRSLYNLSRAADFYESGWQAWAIWAACLAGAARLYVERRRWELLTLFMVVAVPIAAVVVKKYGAYNYNPWHMSSMLPAIFTVAGAGLCWMLGTGAVSRLAAVGVAAGLAVMLALTSGPRIFSQDALIWDVIYPHRFKTIAKQFPAGEANALFAVDDAFITGGISWYLNQYRAQNPLEHMSLEPGRTSSRLTILSSWDTFGGVPVAGKPFFGALPVSQGKLDTQHVWAFDFRRLPARSMDSLPFLGATDMNPGEVLGRALSLKDMTLQHQNAWQLHPVLQESPCSVEFEYENRAGGGAQKLYFAIPYKNSRAGNSLVLSVGFDDEPLAAVAKSNGPDIRQLLLANVSRPAPYGRLRVRLDAVCANSPEYLTGGLGSLTVDGLTVAACASGDDGPCSDVAKGWLEEMMRGMYLGTGFTDAHPDQKATWSPTDFTDEPQPDRPGWHILRPTNPAAESVVRVELNGSSGDFVFFPRLGGQSSVTARLAIQGKPAQDIQRVPGKDRSWTPIAARYPLTVPKGADLEIVLQGPGAQLWLKNDQAVFNR